MRLNQSMWSLAMRWLSTAVMRGREASPGAFAGACLLLFASVSAHASEEMGPVYVVKSDPSIPTTIFAGAERGLFKSTDAGATWAATGLNETTTAVAIAPVTPTIVYAGTNSGLFQSSDGGTNWSPAGVPNPICAVEVDPATPTTLYASTCSQIAKSMDGGVSWGLVGPADGQISSVAIAVGQSTILYAGSSREDGVRVFSSTDGGVTWSGASVSNPDPFYVPLWGLAFDLAIDPTTPTTVYVNSSGWGCDNDGCFTTGTISKSTDAGGSWAAIDSVRYYGSWVSPYVAVSRVAIDPIASTTLYAAWIVHCDQFAPWCGTGDHWISKSTDGGATWSRISDIEAWALWFDALTPTVLYAATGSGVRTSTDGGVTWSGTDPPPPADTTPPDTSIGSATDGTGSPLTNNAATPSGSATFSFTGTDDAGLSGFECRLDGAGFSNCTSPVTFNGLVPGGHVFEVRAIDTSGLVDPAPARFAWTVDQTAPQTVVTSGPTGTITQSTAAFTWSGSDNVTAVASLMYAYRLHPLETTFSGFTGATSRTYSGLPNGTYTFHVKARDLAGNEDPTPATRTFTVNQPPLLVTTPNGGETWRAGTVQVISWRYAGIPDGTLVKIILLKGGLQSRIITQSTSIGTNGSGSLSWTVPSTQTPGTDYKVRVVIKSNTTIKDVSDGRFTIVKP